MDIWDDVMTNRYIVVRTHGHTSSLAKTTKTKFDVSSEVHSISVYIISSSERSYVFVRFFIALPTLARFGGDIKKRVTESSVKLLWFYEVPPCLVTQFGGKCGIG